jgi:pimeloyl-ACP methyl ester carboxylesterase
MSRNKTSGMTPRNQTLVTAAEWFAGGQRVWYDPESARVQTGSQAAAATTALLVFERIAGAGHGADEDRVWLTMLPGFPDGSYGWAQVDRMLGDDLIPRLYVEPVGQGDSDKPRDYRYSTIERADLVEALWRHHRVRRTVVVTFDYTSLALLELLRRQMEQPTSGGIARPVIEAAFMVNGGLFADAHPPARTPGRSPDLPRRTPDHQRAPGPSRRRDPPHRRTPRRRHPRPPPSPRPSWDCRAAPREATPRVITPRLSCRTPTAPRPREAK